jgi:plasmid stabilization system protein ParE
LISIRKRSTRRAAPGCGTRSEARPRPCAFKSLDRAVAEIAEHPARWPAYLHGTRRRLLRGFPYSLVYLVRDERVVVIACQHGRRRPGYWRDRIG